MTVTAIKQQVKNPDRASIFVDGAYSFSLSLDELVGEKLRVTAELSPKELSRLKQLSEDGKVRSRALEWVLNRPRSRREVSQYLYRKKASAELIDRLIKEFSERKYIDEQRFAVWLIDLRQRRGKSNRAIRAELISKGVDSQIISEVLAGNEEIDRLRELAAKKATLSRYQADPKKLMLYLVRQGYAYDDVVRALHPPNS